MRSAHLAVQPPIAAQGALVPRRPAARARHQFDGLVLRQPDQATSSRSPAPHHCGIRRTCPPAASRHP
jgi:hypothetical protein